MVKTRLKAEEFFALPLERGELVDGEVHEEMPPKPEHGRIAGEVFFRIRLWLEETGLGVAGVEGGFILRRELPSFGFRNPVQVLGDESAGIKGLLRPHDEGVPLGIQSHHIKGLMVRKAEAMALAHGVAGKAFVRPQKPSIHMVNGAGRRIGKERGNPLRRET